MLPLLAAAPTALAEFVLLLVRVFVFPLSAVTFLVDVLPLSAVTFFVLVFVLVFVLPLSAVTFLVDVLPLSAVTFFVLVFVLVFVLPLSAVTFFVLVFVMVFGCRYRPLHSSGRCLCSSSPRRYHSRSHSRSRQSLQ